MIIGLQKKIMTAGFAPAVIIYGLMILYPMISGSVSLHSGAAE